MENGFQGKEGQQMPEMTDEFISQVSERYIELFNHVTGKTFEKQPVTEAELQEQITAVLATL